MIHIKDDTKPEPPLPDEDADDGEQGEGDDHRRRGRLFARRKRQQRTLKGLLAALRRWVRPSSLDSQVQLRENERLDPDALGSLQQDARRDQAVKQAHVRRQRLLNPDALMTRILTALRKGKFRKAFLVLRTLGRALPKHVLGKIMAEAVGIKGVPVDIIKTLHTYGAQFDTPNMFEKLAHKALEVGNEKIAQYFAQNILKVSYDRLVESYIDTKLSQQGRSPAAFEKIVAHLTNAGSKVPSGVVQSFRQKMGIVTATGDRAAQGGKAFVRPVGDPAVIAALRQQQAPVVAAPSSSVRLSHKGPLARVLGALRRSSSSLSVSQKQAQQKHTVKTRIS